jgi:NitT/TauT family transport system substrate-binding protein
MAEVRGLKWIATHSVDEIAAVMPEEYALGDKALYVQSIKNSLPMYSPDGRFSREAAEIATKVLKEFDADVRATRTDVAVCGKGASDAAVVPAPALISLNH